MVESTQCIFRCYSSLARPKYIRSPHSNERVAEKIQILNHEYGISNKIVATVTDNAKYFSKAFREFGLPLENLEFNEPTNEDDVEFHDLGGCALSYHHRCTAHTLALIGKLDSLDALDDGFFFRMYSAAMKKLEKLWNLANNTKANEIFYAQFKCSITKLSVIRWNARFDAVRNTMKKDSDKLKSAMTKMGIDPLISIDRDFLNEYIETFTPLAVLLDHMQRSNSYFGQLLPSLCSTKHEMIEMKGKKI